MKAIIVYENEDPIEAIDVREFTKQDLESFRVLCKENKTRHENEKNKEKEDLLSRVGILEKKAGVLAEGIKMLAGMNDLSVADFAKLLEEEK